MLKEALFENPLLTQPQMIGLLSEKGVHFSKLTLQTTHSELKAEYYASLVEPYRPRKRQRCKTAPPIPCNVDRTALPQLEPLLRQHLAFSQSPNHREVTEFLKLTGYVLCEEPWFLKQYLQILYQVPCAGRVLNQQEWTGYAVVVRNLLVDEPDMSQDDLLKAFNASTGMCYVIEPAAFKFRLSDIRGDVTKWLEEAQRCRGGPIFQMPPYGQEGCIEGRCDKARTVLAAVVYHLLPALWTTTLQWAFP